MIASVQRQTYTDWEHILVDDGSTDDTAEVIERSIAGEPRARLIRQANSGVCAARNAGYDQASTDAEYVSFPDSDDVLDEANLRTVVAYLDANPQVGMVHCDFVYIDENDRVLQTPARARYVPTGFGVRALSPHEPLTPFVSLYCWAWVPEPVVTMRRSVYVRTTGWPEDHGQHGEGVVLLPQFALMSSVHFVPRVLYYYRRRAGQWSEDTRNHERAQAKVVTWWQNARWLDTSQREVLAHAEWFRRYRLEPWKGIRYAAQHARSGRLLTACRFAIGAARRYAISFVRTGLPQA